MTTTTRAVFTAVKGDAGVCVTRADRDHFELETLIEGQHNVARLPIEQAVALAVAILADCPLVVMRVAEALDDETAAALGQAFLLPGARRAMERSAKAAEIN